MSIQGYFIRARTSAVVQSFHTPPPSDPTVQEEWIDHNHTLTLSKNGNLAIMDGNREVLAQLSLNVDPDGETLSYSIDTVYHGDDKNIIVMRNKTYQNKGVYCHDKKTNAIKCIDHLTMNPIIVKDKWLIQWDGPLEIYPGYFAVTDLNNPELILCNCLVQQKTSNWKIGVEIDVNNEWIIIKAPFQHNPLARFRISDAIEHYQIAKQNSSQLVLGDSLFIF